MRHATWVSFGLAAAGTIAYASFLAAGSPESWDTALNTWVYHQTLLFSALTCFLKALTSKLLRGAWIAFGVGLTFWAAADVYWVVELATRPEIPYPSMADAGYLMALPCFFVGIGLLTRHRVGHFTAASWIDGAIVALAAGSAAVALLAPALIAATESDHTATVLTNLAYPVGDMVLLAFAAAAVAVSGWRGSITFLLIGLGLVIWAGADAYYLYATATDTYSGGFLDLLWPLGALAIALSACFSLRQRSQPELAYRAPLWLPAVSGLLATSLLVWDHFDRFQEAAVWLAGGTLATVALRLVMSFRENNRLMAALHDETLTDGLTGLGNRRRLLADLEDAVADQRQDRVLAFFDLDGFKTYNDTFGHLAGDALLRRLGAELGSAVGYAGRAYRLGGDEFCILVRSDQPATEPLVEASRHALSTMGEGFEIGSSCGFTGLRGVARTPSDAMRIVDQRMYADKATRSNRGVKETQALLLRILHEREPDLSDHVEGVARNAVEMAHALGMEAEDLDTLRRAAQLHDIGKIAIPAEILRKAQALDATESDLMRRHTLIGERILGAAPVLLPVAKLVRSSHERWDGEGYPDGWSGERIPLGSRIIFICDAFDAMTSDRPYKKAISEVEAIAELRRHAGTQFDPEMVEQFIWLQHRHRGIIATSEPVVLR